MQPSGEATPPEVLQGQPNIMKVFMKYFGCNDCALMHANWCAADRLPRFVSLLCRTQKEQADTDELMAFLEVRHVQPGAHKTRGGRAGGRATA